MATSVQTATPPATQAAAAPRAARRGWLRFPIIIGVILLLIAATYAYAWFDAARLTNQYLSDADTSYAAGKYLDALVGYEQFDQATNKYVTRGGYMQVQKIWSDS